MDVDDLRKKKLKVKFEFLKSQSSDDGGLVLFANDYFAIVRRELTFFLCLKVLN